MAGGSGKRGDRVLESRHLVGLFLGVVLLCGVFFTLGYVMGRSQYGSILGAAVTGKASANVPSKTVPAEKPAAVDSPEWDIYSTNRSSGHLESPAKSSSALARSPSPTRYENAPAAPKPVPTSEKSPGRFQPPRIPRGAIVLQVAASTKEGDALALADALQQKKFPSFVLTPTSDNFYRVQVGPYRDLAAAEQAKKSLERAGFKAIVKH